MSLIYTGVSDSKTESTKMETLWEGRLPQVGVGVGVEGCWGSVYLSIGA